MKTLLKLQKALLFLIIAVLMVSCEANKLELVEATKDLNGTWRVTKVTQNSNDITANLDLEAFRLVFNNDSYQFVNQNIPFLVEGDGKWSFNDPQFPFSINFKPTSGGAKTSKIDFPITGSKRDLTLTFDLGCYRNVYQFTFRQDNN